MQAQICAAQTSAHSVSSSQTSPERTCRQSGCYCCCCCCLYSCRRQERMQWRPGHPRRATQSAPGAHRQLPHRQLCLKLLPSAALPLKRDARLQGSMSAVLLPLAWPCGRSLQGVCPARLARLGVRDPFSYQSGWPQCQRATVCSGSQCGTDGHAAACTTLQCCWAQNMSSQAGPSLGLSRLPAAAAARCAAMPRVSTAGCMRSRWGDTADALCIVGRAAVPFQSVCLLEQRKTPRCAATPLVACSTDGQQHGQQHGQHSTASLGAAAVAGSCCPAGNLV